MNHSEQLEFVTDQLLQRQALDLVKQMFNLNLPMGYFNIKDINKRDSHILAVKSAIVVQKAIVKFAQQDHDNFNTAFTHIRLTNAEVLLKVLKQLIK